MPLLPLNHVQGAVKQVIPCEEHEGVPVCMSVMKTHLVCGTSRGCVKLWDITARCTCGL